MLEGVPPDGFKTEREWHEYFSHPQLGTARVAEMESYYARVYSKVNETSLRHLVTETVQCLRKGRFKRYLRDDFFRYLTADSENAPHPDAWELLAEYGRFYTPAEEFQIRGEPEPEACYTNARVHMSFTNRQYKPRARLVYVEGLTMGALCLPMPHAWNARGLEGCEAVDWSLYGISHWCRYLGIAFTGRELARLRRFQPVRGSLFCRNTYTPRVAEFVRANRTKVA